MRSDQEDAIIKNASLQQEWTIYKAQMMASGLAENRLRRRDFIAGYELADSIRSREVEVLHRRLATLEKTVQEARQVLGVRP